MKTLLLFLVCPLFLIAQTQIGQDIDGEAAINGSGESISLSSDGTVVAIGATGNIGNGSTFGAGHVRIYKNISDVWTQVGSDIDGEASSSTGWSVSLSSDGSVVAIGAIAENDSGHVRIYENLGGSWIQIGADINGEALGDRSGTSVSLSSDGSIVAIGAIFNSGNGTASGHVRIYENQSSTWVQVGQDIDGEAGGDWSGQTVSLSSDGSIVAIGAPLNDGNGANSGHVRVYDLSAILSIESFNVDYFSYYPNPVKEVLNINLNPGLELKQVNIYNSLGQYLYSTKTTIINTSSLNSGLYFIEVETDQGKSSKKIIVE